MNTKKIEIKTSLTSRVFRFMVLSFFISNIMTVLGSVIDGFVVGNTMDENTIAAVGFVSPVVILFSIIGATACVGFKNVATRYLSKGDTEGAGRAFGEALVIALSLSVIVMILTLMFTPTVVAGLGIHKTSGEYLPCVRYLRGTALGLPAITAMAILSNGVQIEGRRIIAVLSVAVMAVSNILIDVIGVNLLHFNVFGITIGTSVSYYAGTAILVYYYCRENVLIRPTLKEATFKEALLVNKAGLAAGVINTFYSLTLIVKAGLINDALSLYAVESIGLQAYNVIIQVNYFVTAFMSSAVAVMFLLATMFSAEEDKDGFKKVMKSVVTYEIITTAVFSIKYLRSLGFEVNNTLFAENSWYFRNALVRANYSDIQKGIVEDKSYLEHFFRNLLLGEHHELKNRYLLIDTEMQPPEKIGDKKSAINVRNRQAIIAFIKDNGTVKASQVAAAIGLQPSRTRDYLSELIQDGIIIAEGANRNRVYRLK